MTQQSRAKCCGSCRHFGAEPLSAFPDHIMPYVPAFADPSDYRICQQDGEVTELVGDFTICTAEGSCDGWEPATLETVGGD